MTSKQQKAIAKVETLKARLSLIGAELAAHDPNGAKWDYVALLTEWKERTVVELRNAENTVRLAR